MGKVKFAGLLIFMLALGVCLCLAPRENKVAWNHPPESGRVAFAVKFDGLSNSEQSDLKSLLEDTAKVYSSFLDDHETIHDIRQASIQSGPFGYWGQGRVEFVPKKDAEIRAMNAYLKENIEYFKQENAIETQIDLDVIKS